MPQRFNQAQFEREVRAAQRRAQQNLQRKVDAYNREVDRVNRENQRRLDEHNRKVERHNQRVIEGFNRDVAQVNEHNRRVGARNSAVIAELARQLRSASTQGPRYTVRERELADRVQSAVTVLDDREYDAFLSYARIDGAAVGDTLRRELERLGATVWFDAVAIQPGKSQALQMDRGLRSARCGIALLTPAYLPDGSGPSGSSVHCCTRTPLFPCCTASHSRTWRSTAAYFPTSPASRRAVMTFGRSPKRSRQRFFRPATELGRVTCSLISRPNRAGLMRSGTPRSGWVPGASDG